jgi:predicted MFS family arabinose efflux permease
MVLAAMALVPSLVAAPDLTRANARLELGRAVAALLAPASVGVLAQVATPVLGYALAAVAALVALCAALGLRDGARTPAPGRPPFVQALREGARFALRHDLLLGIVLCAVFFNFAFFALMAVIVSYALDRIGLDPTWVGAMQSGYGVGLIAGALAAGPVLRSFEPRFVLIAGPGLATVAALLLLGAPHGGGFAAGTLAFFLLGFGPMLWFICQTSIRQLVTPSQLLGRVAATIQVAIYGVRPLGALAGGWAASLVSLEAALALVVAGFALSLAVPLLSALGRLRDLPEIQAA